MVFDDGGGVCHIAVSTGAMYSLAETGTGKLGLSMVS